MQLFRERLLGSLLDKRAISQELIQKLLIWRHPGFSAHVGEPIAAGGSSAWRTPPPTSSEIRSYADVRIGGAMLTSRLCGVSVPPGAGFARRYSEMRAVVDSRWSA
jgi:hypothetical protein